MSIWPVNSNTNPVHVYNNYICYNFHSIVEDLFFPPVFICLFVWQEVIKRYLKISKKRAVIRARQKSYREKMHPWDGKKRNKQYFISTKCNKIGYKKRKNCDFYEIKVENNGRNFHQRLKKVTLTRSLPKVFRSKTYDAFM